MGNGKGGRIDSMAGRSHRQMETAVGGDVGNSFTEGNEAAGR